MERKNNRQTGRNEGRKKEGETGRTEVKGEERGERIKN